jgi:Asp-tRNA(Asn)/Glu-tRNA(Gln) amidotransferase C subunit
MTHTQLRSAIQHAHRCHTLGTRRTYTAFQRKLLPSAVENGAQSKEEASSEPRIQNNSSTRNKNVKPPTIDVEALLSEPTWSVQSLLPTAEQSLGEYPVAIKQLQHLLRLSALPPPKTMEDEAEMLSTLASQLHFVQEIQKVDTTGVEPLRALRDETQAAEANNEITLETLQDALAQEDVVGKHYKRIQRRQEPPSPPDNPDGWKPLDHAQRKVGKYFAVDSAQAQSR